MCPRVPGNTPARLCLGTCQEAQRICAEFKFEVNESVDVFMLEVILELHAGFPLLQHDYHKKLMHNMRN